MPTEVIISLREYNLLCKRAEILPDKGVERLGRCETCARFSEAVELGAVSYCKKISRMCEPWDYCSKWEGR